jgi:hypothetical protein
MHRQRSPAVALGADRFGRRHLRCRRWATLQAGSQFIDGGLLGHPAEFRGMVRGAISCHQGPIRSALEARARHHRQALLKAGFPA